MGRTAGRAAEPEAEAKVRSADGAAATDVADAEDARGVEGVEEGMGAHLVKTVGRLGMQSARGHNR